MLREKRPHKPEFAHDFVRILSLKIYILYMINLIEYNVVGDTKAPLLRCVLFISELKAGYIITTGQHMNY